MRLIVALLSALFLLGPAHAAFLILQAGAPSTAPPTGVATFGGSGTTYYISSAGSDSNNGTAKATPWAHAPGMPGCTSTCAGNTPTAGANYVFRGGDTWHFANSSLTPYTGGSWAVSTSGNSTDCNFRPYASPGHSTCVYYGIDPTWYSGGAWSRPIMNLDNPTSTSFVASCAYNQYNFTGINITGTYVTVDNLEFTGICASQVTTYKSASYIVENGTHINVLNSYFHGWTEATGSPLGTDFLGAIFGANGGGSGSFNIHRYDVFDGSDSYCSGSGACTGWALQAEGYDLDHSVARHMANGIAGSNSMVFLTDNLFELNYESWDSTVHSNLAEQNTLLTSNVPVYVYNNLIRSNNVGVNLWPEPYATLYVFNNISYSEGHGGANCFMLDQTVTTTTAYYFNNTIDAPCAWPHLSSHVTYTGSLVYENNQFIGYSPLTLTSVYNGSLTGSVTDTGSELFQSEATANGQGYTSSNAYAVTAGGVTIGAGTNMTTFCNTLADATASAACKKASTVVSYNSGAHQVVLNDGVALRGAVAWDAGAYQFANGN